MWSVSLWRTHLNLPRVRFKRCSGSKQHFFQHSKHDSPPCEIIITMLCVVWLNPMLSSALCASFSLNIACFGRWWSALAVHVFHRGHSEHRVDAGADTRGQLWRSPPYESNFIHHDFVQLRKQHLQYKAILLSIVLSQQCCEVYLISLIVVKPLGNFTTKYSLKLPVPNLTCWIRPE